MDLIYRNDEFVLNKKVFIIATTILNIRTTQSNTLRTIQDESMNLKFIEEINKIEKER